MIKRTHFKKEKMFIKEIKVRSSNQIKTSEKYSKNNISSRSPNHSALFDRKNIIKEVLKQYPQVEEEKLKELIKVKESEINISKIVTHDGTDCQVYFCDKVPYFFKIDKDDLFIPTGTPVLSDILDFFLIEIYLF